MTSATEIVKRLLTVESMRRNPEFPFGLSVRELLEHSNRNSQYGGTSEGAIRSALRRLVQSGEVIQWIELGLQKDRLVDLYTLVDPGVEPTEMTEARTMSYPVKEPYPEALSRKHSRAEVLYYYHALESAKMEFYSGFAQNFGGMKGSQ